MWKLSKKTLRRSTSSLILVKRCPTTDQVVLYRTTQEQKRKNMDDAGEPAPEDGDIEELSYHEMLLNRESNPGLPRLVGVNDKRKS
jgi:hypothetical protein